MSFSANKLQFYSYNKPTHRSASDGNSTDVDDIDMSIPPQKPPRVSDILQSNNIDHNNNIVLSVTSTVQPSWMSSTPNSTIHPTTPASAPMPALKYLAVSNETPKSIYSDGLPNAAVSAGKEQAELKLRPKLHATQKRLSFEFGEKLSDISKRSSANPDEKNIDADNHWQTEAEKQPLQNQGGHTIFPSEMRQEVLEMSKRNSGSFETPKKTHENIKSTNKEASISATNTNFSTMNYTLNTFFRTPEPLKTADVTEQTPGSTQSVKDRISFFNKLSGQRSNSFIDFLKSSKTTILATTQNYSRARTSPIPIPFNPRRLSRQYEFNVQQDFCNTQPNVARLSISPTMCNITETVIKQHSPQSATTTANSSPISVQRKSTVCRRISMGKKRLNIVNQNSTASSQSTKVQMHAAMEDISLVFPVKMRIADYERRTKMEYKFHNF